jgi:hypothetical protein
MLTKRLEQAMLADPLGARDVVRLDRYSDKSTHESLP